MNVVLSLDLILYGLILAGLSVLAHCLAPDLVHTTLITGVAGGVLTSLWGVLGLRGFRRRVLPTVTLGVLAVVLLAQTVNAWSAMKTGVPAAKPVAVILTVLAVFAIGQLVNLVQAGRRPQAISRKDADSENSGVPAEGDHHQRPQHALDE